MPGRTLFKNLIDNPDRLHNIVSGLPYYCLILMMEMPAEPVETAPENRVPANNGDRRLIDGIEYIYYDAYWIRYYAPLEDTLTNRKRLIDSLTKRAFHHTEAGINTPGKSLEIAREAFENELDPKRKRINAAMLAGALFNRATDLFTTIVELGELGVQVSRTNELMRQCSDCFQEALNLGQQVKHHSGDEGIDEIWGEPFKAFTMPIADFYQSRFIKIAQSMREIDDVAACMTEEFCGYDLFGGLEQLVVEYAAAARHAAETMKKDPIIFQVWPKFVALGENLDQYRPQTPENADQILRMRVAYGRALIQEGRRLISYIASARVPMPKSSAAYIEKCRRYGRALAL